MPAKTQSATLDSLVLEIRRGAIVLAVLASLKQEQYGYSLKRALGEAGVEIDEGTLYPLLRRLESQGLLESHWSIEQERPRRYYRISPVGKDVLRGLTKEWRSLAGTIERLLS
jgi:PadR family transcriptional regulator, regulatory protein PadR